ncbi:MAG: single-stranded-DNA-specific exonuclease RecJ [Betaproteobacteria bacterium]|nr:single-stranded-DNA-specific exonuclease RecJ [Betaproteobacteria bacterium]MBU6512345.1 single-stranded-DNA-specific exonuclease RecJ [Betaproteobacteria bacterium]MDE1954465.1 single-stranded-DNA-specific exonuclease RecJ [Betaproteobacteria bacterium]MDE2152584.1 single-stranded-DNA-specific exonuclease RecJ [Betaproteobacteria bacterium]
MRFVFRDPSPRHVHRLQSAGLHPLLARLLAGRGVSEPEQAQPQMSALLAPSLLLHADAAARALADAIALGQTLCVVADYDCDGATACAVALRGLRMLGARVDYVVPNRFTTGYGLSPAVVDLVAQRAQGRPHWIITVDNGIASIDGVRRAHELGMRVLITDHHLPAAQLPEADVIVNPNQPGCEFPSKNLAGVGVMFYVLLALRAELRARGVFDAGSQPRLDSLLDLVALGTVADVVRLDANNRLLVAQGLRRMREGRLQPGLRALFAATGREAARAACFDLGFALGPRINAAGRLADMTVGIECLSTDDHEQALELAQSLDSINRERRGIEQRMREQAQAALEPLQDAADGARHASICLYSPEWHEGVVGIVAGRLKELHHRPTFVFAPGGEGELRGSGRSIAGFHLRDALDLVSKREPGLLLRFGGHAAASGCSIPAAGFERFAAAFEAVAAQWLSPELLARELEVDGELEAEWFDVEVASLLQEQVWGQGFAPPVFASDIEVVQQSQFGNGHLRARVRTAGQRGSAVRELVAWNRSDFLPERSRVAWRLEANTWQGRSSPRMVLEAVEQG